LPELSNKIAPEWVVPVLTVVLLFFAGFLALTQEVSPLADILGISGEEAALEEDAEAEHGEDIFSFYEPEEIPEWVLPERWFRSNAGGMALSEVPSKRAALRSEYALSIDYISAHELPDYLLPYYDPRFFIETRILYKNGKENRLQWIFKDKDGLTRFIAAFTELTVNDENIETVEAAETTEEDNDGNEAVKISVQNIIDDSDPMFERIEKNGFMEIYDENGYITTEYRFNYDRSITKTLYNYNNGIIVSSTTYAYEENNERRGFYGIYTDLFRYNRSSFLRAVERLYLRDMQITLSNEPVRITFPGNIMNAAKNDLFINEKLNSYPEFFGDLFVRKNSRMVFATDDRGRILSQILYNNDEENTVIWAIESTWVGERIASIRKTEGDTVLLAEYSYDSKNNRILERNLKDGVLERLVRTEGKTDIEELYMDDVIVLRAVWEDGRKISESRVSNR
jgi:hypothetical protein